MENIDAALIVELCNRLDIIIVILIFNVCLHFSEKWFNIGMKLIRDGGKVDG